MRSNNNRQRYVYFIPSSVSTCDMGEGIKTGVKEEVVNLLFSFSREYRKPDVLKKINTATPFIFKWPVQSKNDIICIDVSQLVPKNQVSFIEQLTNLVSGKEFDLVNTIGFGAGTYSKDESLTTVADLNRLMGGLNLINEKTFNGVITLSNDLLMIEGDLKESSEFIKG